MNSKELFGRMQQKQKELQEIFEEHTDADGNINMPDDIVIDVRSRNDELSELGKKYDKIRELEAISDKNQKALTGASKAVNHLSPPHPKPKKHKEVSLGDAVIESKAYQDWTAGQKIYIPLNDANANAKATFSRDSGFAPEVTRTGRVELIPTRRIVVADLMPSFQTTQSAIQYMEEILFDNQATFITEGGTLSESGLRYEERTITVEKVGHWLPVTNEQFTDAPQIKTLINTRLTLMVEIAEEAALLNGDGTGSNIVGFLNKPGRLTQAQGTDPLPDTIYKGMTRVRYVGFAEPSAVILHPNDWQNIRLLRTTEGVYIWGSPSEPGPERIWGKQIVCTPTMPEGRALLGDFLTYASVARRRGVVIESSNSHAHLFTSDQIALRATKRMTLCVYRASAFCEIVLA